MADTAIPLTTLTPGTGIAQPAGTAITAANTHTITLPGNVCPEEVVLRVVNTTAAIKVATVTAGDAPPSGAGEVATSTVSLADGSVTPTAGLIPLSSKHLQSDGTIVVTVAAAMTGTIAALWLKRV